MPCKDTPTKNTFYDPLNDSPGLLLFGLVFPFFGATFSCFGFYFLCHKNFLYFTLQNTYLKSEEFCLFEYYEDGQDISCRSMMFGASRLLWEANSFCCHFCRDRKEDWERLELLLVRSSSMFFSTSPRKSLCFFAQEFQRIMTVVLLLLVFVMLLLSGRRLSFVIEAGRMAMACT
ncbi:hypothetical protein DER46DRAFT_361323 [Fusarium sp. MPI-SDFR-AT-0072]|nr:hypothetical protein DER46DRAFT_361323 [Fusarium sp. MPI-SDFR-AT-0072]